MDSSTSSPTAALAAVSAALLTLTHRPPPATSIVLPVNGVPIEVAGHSHLPTATELSYQGCRYVDNGKPAGLVVSPLAYVGAEGHHADQHHMSSNIQLASQGMLSST